MRVESKNETAFLCAESDEYLVHFEMNGAAALSSSVSNEKNSWALFSSVDNARMRPENNAGEEDGIYEKISKVVHSTKNDNNTTNTNKFIFKQCIPRNFCLLLFEKGNEEEEGKGEFVLFDRKADGSGEIAVSRGPTSNKEETIFLLSEDCDCSFYPQRRPFHLSLLKSSSSNEVRWDLRTEQNILISQEGDDMYNNSNRDTSTTTSMCLRQDECYIFSISDNSLHSAVPSPYYSISWDGRDLPLQNQTLDAHHATQFGNCACQNHTFSRLTLYTYPQTTNTKNTTNNTIWNLQTRDHHQIIHSYSDPSKSDLFSQCLPLTDQCYRLLLFHTSSETQNYHPATFAYLDGLPLHFQYNSLDQASSLTFGDACQTITTTTTNNSINVNNENYNATTNAPTATVSPFILFLPTPSPTTTTLTAGDNHHLNHKEQTILAVLPHLFVPFMAGIWLINFIRRTRREEAEAEQNQLTEINRKKQFIRQRLLVKKILPADDNEENNDNDEEFKGTKPLRLKEITDDDDEEEDDDDENHNNGNLVSGRKKKKNKQQYSKCALTDDDDNDDTTNTATSPTNPRTLNQPTAATTTTTQCTTTETAMMSYSSLNSSLCHICLEGYKPGETIAFSPNPQCNHEFHQHCITDWLLKQRACPLCRYDFLMLPEENERQQNSNNHGGNGGGGEDVPFDSLFTIISQNP